MSKKRKEVVKSIEQAAALIKDGQTVAIGGFGADNHPMAIVREMTGLLQLEDRIDRAARQKIRSQKRDIAEGGEEYDILHKRYYAEELKKFGINLNN